jgi:hypothetical protein
MRLDLLCIGILLGAASCGTAKHGITDGRYKLGQEDVRVEVINDTIHVLHGSSGAPLLGLPPAMPSGRQPAPARLVQHSFDLDLLTIPLKYRPAAADLQPQLETQVSAALYLGRRTDRYRYHYPDDRFARLEREERHLGLSFGAIGGLGGANVGPASSTGRIAADYVGVVGSYGIAVIGAVDRASLGIAMGRDHLLNSDARLWSHEGAPWIGFAFGLNLN